MNDFPYVKIGFTGRQDGMSEKQMATVWWLLGRGPGELHHGDCVGADAQIHEMAKGLRMRIIVHPPSDSKKRAFCQGYDEIREEKPYLVRNHDIVDECELLLATPRTFHEVMRSGTWATIRYGRDKPKIDVAVILPDGSIRLEFK